MESANVVSLSVDVLQHHDANTGIAAGGATLKGWPEKAFHSAYYYLNLAEGLIL